MSMPLIFCGLSPALSECISAPGPGSRCMLAFSCWMRMPAVRRFCVIVVNRPPPVPRKVSSSVGAGWVICGFSPLNESEQAVTNAFLFAVCGMQVLFCECVLVLLAR